MTALKHLAIVGEGVCLQEWKRALIQAGHQVVVVAPPLPISTLHSLLAGVEGVFECSDQRMNIREERLRALAGALGPEAFVLSVQSERSATALQAASGAPMVVVSDWVRLAETALLEVAFSEGLASKQREYAIATLKTLGKPVEVVQDQVGLVFARTLAMIINEAAFALQEGVATKEDIDQSMRLGANYPQGPLAWADRIGLTRVVALLDGLSREMGTERYRVAPLLRRKALAGLSFYG
jgi:3-hydroxybutyryl-CoA dehydrogenase